MNTFFLTGAAVGGVIQIAQLVLGFFGADHHAGDHHIGSSHDSTSDSRQLPSARTLSAAAKAISNIKFDKIVVWEGGANGGGNGNGLGGTAAFI